MAQNSDPLREDHELDQAQEALIVALLRYGSKTKAAAAAGVSRRQMYRWFDDPSFRLAFRRARRQAFDEALTVLETSGLQAAQALRRELGKNKTGEFSVIAAARSILYAAYKAGETIGVDDELNALRALMQELREAAKAPTPPDLSRYRMSDADQAEAICLRMTWMRELGHSAEDIEHSVRYNRPQSVAEEKHLVEVVRQLLEVEQMYAEPWREDEAVP